MKGTFKAGLIVVLCLALWPAIAGAKPPDPKGTLVYQDDFSDGKKSGLEDNLQATDYSRGFHAPGVYHLILNKPNDIRWSLFPRQSYGDFTFEADVWDNSDEFTGDVSQGLVFRAKDQTHFYTVLVDPRKGQYAVRKWDGGTASDLVAWKASPLVKKQAEVNHLRVDAAGNAFTIYLNGESLANFSDSSYAKGGLGFITSNVDAVVPHMHYDNIKIYTTEAQAAPTGASPSGLPNTGQAGTDASLLLAGLALLLFGLGAWVRSVKR